MRDSKSDETNFARELTTAFVAGTTIAYTTFPLEGLKKLYQINGDVGLRKIFENQKVLHGESTNATLYRILRSGQIGDHKFYRGSTVFALNIVPTTTIQLMTKAFLDKTLPGDSSFLSAGKALICGVAGAIPATVVENCVSRQLVTKTGPIATMRDMSDQSIVRPFKSYGLVATREAIFTLYLFFLTPEARKFAREKWPNNGYAEFAFTLAVNLIGAVISHPFDTVATSMQATHTPITYRKACNDFIANNGIKALYRGVGWRMGLFPIFANVIPAAKECAEKVYDKKIAKRTN